jgi:hypothetical protein
LDINDKAKILSQFVSKYSSTDDETIQDFIHGHNLGLPLSYALHHDYVTFVDNGWATMFVENTYDDLCEFVMCDPSLFYNDISEMITNIDV